jgi:hypothetical protein
MEGHAERAGATGKVLDRFRAAASLPPADQELLADLSPDICRELGIDVRKYPILTALGVLGVHATSLALAVNELKQMQAAQRKEEGKRPVTAASVTAPGTVTRPADPPGAVKVFCDEPSPKNSMGPFDAKENQNQTPKA